jgi:hypothetical protein
MPLQASTPAIHNAGEFEGRHPAPQRGVWGSVPPDPGSALTSKTRNPQVLIVCLDALNPEETSGARIAADWLVTSILSIRLNPN